MKTNKNLFKFLLLSFVSLASLHSCKEDEIIDTTGIHEYVDSEYATIAKNWYDSNSKLSKNNELDFNKLNVEWTDYKVSPLGFKNKLITVPISSKKDKFYREIAIILSENNPPFGVIKEYTGDPFKENTFLNIYSGSGRHLESAIYNKEDGTMQYISRLKSSKSLKSSMRKIANASGNMNDGFEIEEVVVTGYQPPRDYVYIPPIEYPSYDNPDNNYSIPSSPGGGGSNTGSSGSGPMSPNTIITFDTQNEIRDVLEYLKCFNSSSPIQITLFVDQPKANTRNTWAGNILDPDVGHTYIQLEQNGIVRTLGFYPSEGVSPTDTQVKSLLNNDSGHVFDVSITTTISDKNRIDNLLNFVKNYKQTYDLNNYNCTDFGIDAFNKSGTSIRKTTGNWGVGSGRNPGDLGQDLRGLTGGHITVNKTGGTTKQNKGGC